MTPEFVAVSPYLTVDEVLALRPIERRDPPAP